MPWRPSTSMSRTVLPPAASARASAPATVVLPVPPFPVTTCSRTPAQSVSRVVTIGGYLRRERKAAGPPLTAGRMRLERHVPVSNVIGGGRRCEEVTRLVLETTLVPRHREGGSADGARDRRG